MAGAAADSVVDPVTDARMKRTRRGSVRIQAQSNGVGWPGTCGARTDGGSGNGGRRGGVRERDGIVYKLSRASPL